MAISEACGLGSELVGSTLASLVEAGLALKVGSGFARSGRAIPVLEGGAAPFEIGRRILLCLTEPRRAKDIARIINKPQPNATAQLRHLLRRGLVVGVGKGVYDVVRPTPPASGSGRQRQAEHRQRLARTGLVQVAAWVPDGRQASILELAKRLRAEAGVLLPTERSGPIPATHAAQRG